MSETHQDTHRAREKAVFRQLALPVSVFDHIKATQRAHLETHGEALSLNDTVAKIIREHQQHEEREGRTHEHEEEPAATRRAAAPAPRG